MTEQPAPSRFTYFPPERLGFWPSQIFSAALQPLRTVPRNWRSEAPFAALLFFILLIFFAISTPTTVTLEDDALFIGNLHFWGVAHPPGYPAYTLLGGIFYHLLPWGSAAFKAHFFSGFAAAGTCVALYAIVAMLIPGRIFPALAAVAYAASKTFWSQAIIAEVYTLNTFLFFTLLAFAIDYASQRRPQLLPLLIMAAITGVGLANHYPLLLLGGVGVFLLVFPRLPNKIFMTLAAMATAAATALPFYLWLVWRSHQTALAAHFYGDPINSISLFWHYVLRKGYATVDQQSGVEWSDKLFFAENFAGGLLWQFTPIGFALVLIGFVAMACSRYRWLWLCMAMSFLCSSVVLLWLLNFQVGFIALAVFRVYYLLAYGMMAIWLALGAAWLIDLLANKPIPLRRIVALALFTVVSGSIIGTHWTINNRSDYTWAEDLANRKLASIEPNSVLFVHDDLDLPTIYLHQILGKRPDILLYSDQGLILPNRLFSPLLPEFPPANNPQTESRIAYLQQFINTETAPIYYNSVRSHVFTTPTFGSDFLGFYRRVNRTTANGHVLLDDSVKTWLQENLSDTIVLRDPWTQFQQYETISSVMNAVVQAAEEGSLTLTEQWREIIRTAREKNPKTRVLTNFIRLEKMDAEERQTEINWLANFDLNSDAYIDKFGRGRFYLLKARFAELNNDKSDPLYEESLQQALVEDERISNPAIEWLLDYYYSDPSYYCSYLNLINRYYPNAEQISPARLAELRVIRKNALCL